MTHFTLLIDFKYFRDYEFVVKYYLYLCLIGENRWKLFGVTSWGSRCGERGLPGVYVRVSAYITWIRDVLNSTDSPNEDHCESPAPPPNAYLTGGTDPPYESGRLVQFLCNECFTDFYAAILARGRLLEVALLTLGPHVLTPQIQTIVNHQILHQMHILLEAITLLIDVENRYYSYAMNVSLVLDFYGAVYTLAHGKFMEVALGHDVLTLAPVQPLL